MLFAGVAAGASFGCQQRTPRWLDYPLNDPTGMGNTQRGDCRKGMENVAHGAETDHEQAKLGLRLQILIFSHQSFGTVLGQPIHQVIKSGRFVFDLAAQVNDLKRPRRYKISHANSIFLSRNH